MTKKVVGAALAVGVVAAGAGVGVALWSATGSGSGSATAYTAQGITATAVAAPAADTNLYPGGSAVAVYFTVDNPNPYRVEFTGWSGAAVSSVTPVSGTCTAADFGIDAASGTFGSALQIPANTAASPGVSGSAAGVFHMLSTAGDGCQGALVKVSLTLTGGAQY